MLTTSPVDPVLSSFGRDPHRTPQDAPAALAGAAATTPNTPSESATSIATERFIAYPPLIGGDARSKYDA
jgi:hypothetical protein